MRFALPAVITRAATIVITMTLPAFAQGAGPRSDLVVSPAWVAAHLSDPNLVLLHVGPPDDFARRHIAGAHFTSTDVISESDHAGNGLMLEMPSAEKLRQGLESLGISDNSNIVVYFDKEWFTPSTRLVFTLDYAGLSDRTHYLDGGLDAWVREGHAVTAETTAPWKPGRLSALRLRPIVVNAEYVRSHLATPRVTVVDARASVFYDGTQAGRDHAGPMRRGHITGAVSVPFSEIIDDQGMLKTLDQLRSSFAKAGVQPGDTIVGYCHIGQQATGMLLGARLLGHPALLYDGSFEDWSRHAEYPVEASPARGKP